MDTPKDPIDLIRKYALELAISICRDGRGIVDDDDKIMDRAERFHTFLAQAQQQQAAPRHQ